MTAITTNNSVNINMILPKGTVTSYAASITSVWVTFKGVDKRYNCDSVTNATTTTDGVLSFNTISCTEDGLYSFRIVTETNASYDDDGIGITTINRGYFQKATSISTVVV